MTTSLHDHFRWIPDPRTGNNKKHNLLEVIILSVLAVVCGAESWYEMEEFGKEKEDFLKQLLPLENGIPSHDTINRVFMMIDADVLNAVSAPGRRNLARAFKQQVHLAKGN
ncbi:transposase family protein [Mucilaginibacter rubeus]|uniref:transposase family protein n=1 Tax=Mucilaginibacter rubeus TaxID=2027860 RepID=UPI001AA13224|nr:transposase family protein [Mucilaginibacter rubeus]QTE40646.1 transposase family protein [Mucilaginibacter rubeus]